MYIGEKLCQKYNFYFFEKKFFSHSQLQLNKMSVFLIVMMLFAVKELVGVEMREKGAGDSSRLLSLRRMTNFLSYFTQILIQ